MVHKDWNIQEGTALWERSYFTRFFRFLQKVFDLTGADREGRTGHPGSGGCADQKNDHAGHAV